MPVLPEVASISGRPGLRVPFSMAFQNMNQAARSLIEPVGLNHSSLAKSRVPAGARRENSTSGVLPGFIGLSP